MTVKTYIKKIVGLLLLTAVVMALSAAFATGAAEGSAAVTVKEINYENSTIKVRLAEADSALLISDSKQKKWEYVPAEKDSEGCVTLDISWIKSTADYVLSLKGDTSSSVVKVTLPKQKKDFKAKYSTADGGSITFQNVTGTVEWKKKEALEWEKFPVDASGKPDTAAFSGTLYGLCSNGAVLLFRLAPVNGTGSNPGSRASKELTVTVAKKTAAPSINIDDEKMTIAVTKNLQYRYCDNDGNPDEGAGWMSFTKAYDCPLSFIAPKAMYSASVPARDVYVQFRTAATSSKQVSFISTACIPAQEDIGTAAKNGIKIVYTSTNSFQIEVPSAGTDEPYEYCVINQDDIKDGVKIDDVDEITWKPITSPSPVLINETKDKVGNGSRIYVRRKAYGTFGEEGYRLASPYLFLGEISYPKDITTLQNLVWLQTVAGTCNEENSDGRLSFTFYSETNSPITEIQFVDYSSTGTKRGTALKNNEDFNSIVSENSEYDSSVESENDPKHYRYIINTTIISTKKVDSVAENAGQRAMLAYIKIKDSAEYFKSDSEKGIGLYLHPAAKINNPRNSTQKAEIASLLGWTGYNANNDNIGYSTKFERIFNSNRIYGVNNGYEGYNRADRCDAAAFRIRLDIGTRYIPKSATRGELETGASNKVSVTKITYDNVEFAAGAVNADNKAYFTVEYADITGTSESDNGEAQRMAVITVNADVIEKDARVDDRDKDTPLIIYLSNGEIIKDAVTMNLRNTAVIVDYKSHSEGAQSLTLNSMLKTEDVTTVTTNGETTTTVTDHPDDNHIALKKISAGYDVTLKQVTWNGCQICKNITTEAEFITMDISNELLNQAYQTVSKGSSLSKYLIFEFDNGFSINSGWKITINRPATE